jgi:sulfide:quinone oxidoreductase
MAQTAARGASPPGPRRRRVVIAGGGVAALEALLALRHLLGERVNIDIAAPTREFVYRPLSVGAPFGTGAPPRFSLAKIAQDHGASFHLATVQSVEHDRGLVRLRDDGTLSYDALLIATGARTCDWLAGAISFSGPDDVQALKALVCELERAEIDSIAFIAPRARSWTLPLYELAFLTAARVAELRIAGTRLAVVTPEHLPLEVFGPAATRHLRELCANRGISLRTGSQAVAFAHGRLELADEDAILVDRVVALPELKGNSVAGVPCDSSGFIAVDQHGAVPGLPGVYAAGDGADHPIKQGGLATQEADVAAEAIAAWLAGAPAPPGLETTLRGQLLTGLSPAYLTAAAPESGGHGSSVTFDIAREPLGKISGRYLPAYLSQLASSDASA